jgi:hypothetical protein
MKQPSGLALLGPRRLGCIEHLAEIAQSFFFSDAGGFQVVLKACSDEDSVPAPYSC